MNGTDPEPDTLAAAGPDWHHDRLLDLRGDRCPLPVLKARKALLGMAPGARLLVVTTDPMAAIDLPHFCAQSGHRLLRQERTEEGHRFLIAPGSGAHTPDEGIA